MYDNLYYEITLLSGIIYLIQDESVSDTDLTVDKVGFEKYIINLSSYLETMKMLSLEYKIWHLFSGHIYHSSDGLDAQSPVTANIGNGFYMLCIEGKPGACFECDNLVG